jgi:hypothetical protein
LTIKSTSYDRSRDIKIAYGMQFENDCTNLIIRKPIVLHKVLEYNGQLYKYYFIFYLKKIINRIKIFLLLFFLRNFE